MIEHIEDLGSYINEEIFAYQEQRVTKIWDNFDEEFSYPIQEATEAETGSTPR